MAPVGLRQLAALKRRLKLAKWSKDVRQPGDTALHNTL